MSGIGTQQVVEFTAPGAVRLAEIAPEEMRRGSARVRTLYSGLSAGTELTTYRGSNPYLAKRWDPLLHRFEDDAATFTYPVIGWGYSEVGEVVEVEPYGGPEDEGLPPLEVGSLVWGAWGHRSDAVVPLDRTAARWLPGPVTPIQAVFARVGAIALNAVLAGDLKLGEVAAVFGQGVIGLLATRLAVLGGVDVVAVDALDRRLEVARAMGAAPVSALDPRGVADAIRDAAHGRRPDVCIELSGSYRALHEAIRSAGVDGTVVAAGFYQGEGVGLRLGEEFHHNRVRIVASQIGAVPTPLRARWDVLRLERTFVGMIANGKLDVAPLISHVIPAAQVADAYLMLDEQPADALQVVLDFTDGPSSESGS
ncbi:MAG: zinc-binding alcohol dehydrogenase [Actinomycetota bacterium]|nr:zinc-binding alcohol dehydrogenase [Actinomycetota bacterium]